MRAIPVVFLAVALLICAVSALPARSAAAESTVSDDVELVPRGTSAPKVGRRPVTSEDSDSDETPFHVDAVYTPDFTQSSFGNPFYSNFGNFGIDFGFAQRIQDIVRRLYSTPQESDLGLGIDSDDDFHGSLVPIFNTGVLVSASQPDGKQDDDKTETTSTVKIINGHKYVINDTITTKNTRFGQSVFKVRTVDMLPLDDEDTATATTDVAQPKEAESTSTAAPPSSSSAAPADIDRGSPEVLESESHNEISHNLDDDSEVLKKANRSDKIVLQV